MTLKKMEPLIRAVEALDAVLKVYPKVISVTFTQGQGCKVLLTFEDFYEAFKGETVKEHPDGSGWCHYEISSGGVTFTACRPVAKLFSAEAQEVVL